MIDFKEIATGEDWELFARDFLQEMGFFTESSPDRGADGGKDVLMSEELSGILGRYRFKWLVSCKHNAVSGISVSETEEPNILERVKSFAADGFIGFYSTVPSAGLNTRLNALRNNNSIKDFRIFDHQLIENYLVSVGFSTLLMRYFPESYTSVKPLHLVVDQYVPLNCRHCGKDLLKALYEEEYAGNVAFATRTTKEEPIGPTYIEDMYWACKGECDRILERYYWERDRLVCTWADLGDLVIPTYFLWFMFDTTNSFRRGGKLYSDQAYEKLKTFMVAIAQKVLRETTGRENDRVQNLIDLASLFN